MGLTTDLTEALRDDPGRLPALDASQAVSWRDALSALIALHDLHLAPIETLGASVRLQHDPDTARVKRDLEARLVAHLDAASSSPRLQADAVGELRRIAKQDLVPEAYEWLAREASFDELRHFLAIEGGPDGGFDDLVAICQIGLTGTAKLVLGANYWDEMGRGEPDAVHTELHRRLVRALDLSAPEDALPIEALERTALNGLLATNRWLQPEMIGALGLLELQAGPRCRRVLAALQRLGAPADAFPFYEEHAAADPRHGKDWLERGVRAVEEAIPDASQHIVRGARWRSDVNHRLFESLRTHCAHGAPRAA
ncbi:MAG: iron-containing redox enzyme family protein [Acidimicrobiia bacterium]